MSHEIIINLLFCAKTYNKSDVQDVKDSFEFLDENVRELEEFKKYYPNKNLLEKDVILLLNKVNSILNRGGSKIILNVNNSPWDEIAFLAMEILKSLNIEYMDPWLYLDNYYEGP